MRKITLLLILFFVLFSINSCSNNEKKYKENISYYENLNGDLSFTGILADSYGNLVVSRSVMTPTFSDIDNDGDMDFFTGNMVGTLTHYKNIGLLDDNLPVLEYVTDSWQDISIVGGMRDVDRHGASAITFIDIDLDGDLDLSWGDYFQQSLYIIWNIGSSEVPIMNELEITNQYPPKDPIISAGQNMPTFSDLDNDGDNDLFVTGLSGAYGNQLINNFICIKRSRRVVRGVLLPGALNLLTLFIVI